MQHFACRCRWTDNFRHGIWHVPVHKGRKRAYIAVGTRGRRFPNPSPILPETRRSGDHGPPQRAGRGSRLAREPQCAIGIPLRWSRVTRAPAAAKGNPCRVAHVLRTRDAEAARSVGSAVRSWADERSIGSRREVCLTVRELF